MDPLSDAIETRGADAYVMYASSRDADMRYMTHFISSDPFVFFKKPGKRGVIIVSQMEIERASREAAVPAMTRTQAGLPEILKTEPDLYRATAKMIVGQAGEKLLVPPDFPVVLANSLGEFGAVLVDKGTIRSMRAKKSKNEILFMKNVQKAAEKSMRTAISLIRKSSVKKGILYAGKKPLTAEYIKFSMHRQLLQLGCAAVDTIVSCGEETAVPHITGTGPLKSGEPIVIDIFPTEERSGYYADMTRTVVKGEPSTEILEMYDTLREAKKLGISRVKEGVTGADVHQAVVDFFTDHGYESNSRGFIHNLGHGVGLQIHELPTVGPAGKALESGNVITIEPGLYYPGTGGVRLEDMGVVTKSGYENFTVFPEELVV